jgi:hypothetical protein
MGAAMSQLIWILQHWRSYLGVVGLAGFSCLCLALVLLLMWLQPLRHQQHTLAQDLAALQRPDVQNQQSERQSLRLADFYRQFPHLNSAPDWLDQIDQKLRAHKLVLKQADYKLVRERNSPLLRYQLNLPVSGDYLEIRACLQELQQSMSFLIIEDVALERDSTTQTVVQAKLRLSLMFGGS